MKNKYLDKNSNPISLGDKVLTKHGYNGNVSMFGEDNSIPPNPRVIVRLNVGVNTMTGRGKGYYPSELEIIPQSGICYKTGQTCKYNCSGLCKESV